MMSLAVFLLLNLWRSTAAFAAPGDTLVFTYTTDRDVDAPVYLSYATDGLPGYYYCDLKTPICIDNLCNPIEIRLEWDLLGNFHNYLEVKGKEITKFDHEPFQSKDHEQLKAILSDKESLLQDYLIEDLTDTTKKVYSTEIDGLTAATSTTFADKLVPGAIYTCYTLWHLVNGEIADRIQKHTRRLLNTALRKKMLLSGVTVYEDYVLDGIRPGESSHFATELFRLTEHKNRFIAIKSIRKLPEPLLAKTQATDLVRKFSTYDFPVQSAIIRYFIAGKCDTDLLREWVNIVGTLPEGHKTGVYKLIESNLDNLTGGLKKKLLHFLESKEENKDGNDKKLMTLLSTH